MSSALVVGSPRNPRHRGLTRLDILLATGRVEMGGDATFWEWDPEDEEAFDLMVDVDHRGFLSADGTYVGPEDPLSEDDVDELAWFYEPSTYDYDALFGAEPHGEPFLDTKPMFGLEDE